MFDELTPEEIALLRDLVRDGAPVAEVRLSTEALRTLALRRYVKRLSGFSVATPEGRRALEAIDRGEEPESVGPRPAAFPELLFGREEPVSAAREEPDTTLSALQEDMLRQIARADAPVPVDDLDGRVVLALEARGLATRSGGRVEVSDAGREFYRSRVRRRRRARSTWHRGEAPAERSDERASRARAIREAVDALRRVVGGAEKIPIEELDATADEAFRALLELADRIERGADPRRITPG